MEIGKSLLQILCTLDEVFQSHMDPPPHKKTLSQLQYWGWIKQVAQAHRSFGLDQRRLYLAQVYKGPSLDR